MTMPAAAARPAILDLGKSHTDSSVRVSKIGPFRFISQKLMKRI
jgi:hypothetical protein